MRFGLKKLYNELYSLEADLNRAEYYVEIENLEEEIAFLEGVIWNLEQEEI